MRITGIVCALLLVACDGETPVDAGQDSATPGEDAGRDDAGDDAGDDDPDAGRGDAGGAPDGGLDAGMLGPPSIIARMSEVNLGTFTCGGAVPVARMVTIENQGQSPGTIVVNEGLITGVPDDVPWLTAVVGDNVLDPGETTQLVITPTPSLPMRPILHQAVVWVSAAETPGVSAVTTTLTVSGPYLIVTTSAQDFGAIPVGRVADVNGNLTVFNQGDLPATIDVDADFEPGFNVTWAGMPSALPLAGGAGELINVTFQPAGPGEVRGTLAVSTSDDLCGLEADALAASFSGTGITGSLGVSALDVDFGTSLCGTTGESQTLLLRNNGGASLDWGASVAGGTARFTLDASSGTIAAGATTMLRITAVDAPDSAFTLPADLSDTLTLTSSIAGDTPRVIPLRRALGGGLLRWSHPNVGVVAPLGETGSTVPSLINEGTAPVRVTSFVHDAALSITPATDVDLPAGRAVPIAFYYTPATVGAQQFTVSIGTTGPGVCNRGEPLRVVGRAAGALEFSTSQLSLEASCGGRPIGLVLVSNNGGSTENFSLELDPPGVFEARSNGLLVSALVGVNPGETRAFEITRRAAFPTDAAPGVIDIGSARFTTVAGDVHEVELRTVVHGSHLQAHLVDRGAWEVPVGDWTDYEVVVANSGDRPFTLLAEFPNGTNRVFTVPIATTAGAGTVTLASEIRVPSAGPLTPSAQVTFRLLDGQSSEGLCSELPGTVFLRPTGIVGSLAVETTLLSFGDNPCGGPTPPSRVATLRNDGLASLNYTASLASGTRFTITAGETGTILPGGTASITVAPRTVGFGSVPGRAADTLVIQSDVSGEAPRAVALEQNVYGAVIALPSALPLPTVAVGEETFGFLPRLAGNTGVQLTFDESGSDLNDELDANLFVSYGYGITDPQVRLTGRVEGAKSFSVTPRLPTGVPVCDGTLGSVSITGRVGASPVRNDGPRSAHYNLDCGGSVSSHFAFFENTSAAPVDFTVVDERGGASRWFASPMSGTIAAGATQMISVLPTTPWPLAPPFDYQGLGIAREVWRERITMIVGTSRISYDLTVNMSGAGFVLEPWSSAAGTGFIFGRRFVSTNNGMGLPDFAIADASTGSCIVSGNGSGSCGPTGGTVTFTTSTTRTSGLCSMPGVRTLTFP